MRIDEIASRRKPSKQSQAFGTADDAIAALDRSLGDHSGTWTYQDEVGIPCCQIVRWNGPDGKTIRPVSRIGEHWVIGTMPDRRPLYRLGALGSSGQVFVCADEDNADEWSAMFTATTSAGGSGDAIKTDWTPLAGKSVVILHNTETAEKDYAKTVDGILLGLTPKPTVKIVELPVGEGGAIEFVEIHGSYSSAMAAALRLVDPPVPPAKWVPFPVDLLPNPIGQYAQECARAFKCDPAMVALPLLSGLAVGIGNTRRLLLRNRPPWSEPAIVWTAIVAKTGTKKSPIAEEALRPVRDRQRADMRAHELAMGEYEKAHLRHDKDLKVWKSEKKDTGDPPDAPDRPVCRRCVVDDITVEALAVRLKENPRGVLMARDELSSWLGGFDRYAGGRGNDASKWLELHGGRSITVDRKTATGPVYVPIAGVSVAGGIQPAIIRRLMTAEHRESGLAARLLMAAPPDQCGGWVDGDVPKYLFDHIAKVFRGLFDLKMDTDADGYPEPRLIRLSTEAKTVWIQFVNEHAKEMEQIDDDDIRAVWSKLEGYAARFALILHLASWAAGDVTDPDTVGVDAIRRGVALAGWFGNEERRVYSQFGETTEESKERELVEWIRKRGGSVSAREMTQNRRRYKNKPTEAGAALDALVEPGHGHWVQEQGKGGGPTAKRFVLNH